MLFKEIERAILAKHHRYIIGVDEAGRGSLAGPVVAAACVLLPGFNIKVKDSKKIKEKERERLYDELISCGKILYSISAKDHEVVDEVNILEATMIAMSECVKDVDKQVHKLAPNGLSYTLIDGNRWPSQLKGYEGETVIKGDDKCVSISAASILAKVYHDRIMRKLAKDYPFWGFEKNKGYYCQGHGEKIKLWRYGSKVHRKTFNPLRTILEENEETEWKYKFDDSPD